jgi:hypothetical protein
LVGEYAAGGEVVRASRLVPIGPWCIRWWQRYPAGYRLELEIGDPRREADLPRADQRLDSGTEGPENAAPGCAGAPQAR